MLLPRHRITSHRIPSPHLPCSSTIVATSALAAEEAEGSILLCSTRPPRSSQLTEYFASPSPSLPGCQREYNPINACKNVCM